jgi:hypothetical protein
MRIHVQTHATFVEKFQSYMKGIGGAGRSSSTVGKYMTALHTFLEALKENKKPLPKVMDPAEWQWHVDKNLLNASAKYDFGFTVTLLVKFCGVTFTPVSGKSIFPFPSSPIQLSFPYTTHTYTRRCGHRVACNMEQ